MKTITTAAQYRATATEKQVQRAIVETLRLAGFVVEEIGQHPDPPDHPIPRWIISHFPPHRVGRLKALGNGQVPMCAAEACRLLLRRLI